MSGDGDELRLEGPCHECGGVGPVVIVQCDTDPGDIGEPRMVEDFDKGETIVFVPSFDLWPETDDIKLGLLRNDMGRVIALALASQGYAKTDSEAVGLALLREIEDCGYTLRLTTHEERRAKNANGASS